MGNFQNSKVECIFFAKNRSIQEIIAKILSFLKHLIEKISPYLQNSYISFLYNYLSKWEQKKGRNHVHIYD